MDAVVSVASLFFSQGISVERGRVRKKETVAQKTVSFSRGLLKEDKKNEFVASELSFYTAFL